MSNDKGLKSGKKPLSDKKTFSKVNYDDVYRNPVVISAELQKELDNQGLVPRWVDYKKVKEYDGYHRAGWRVYFRKKDATLTSEDAQLGMSPDGLVRRGSLVLAVKSREEVVKHKAFLKEKAENYSTKTQQQQAKELRQLAQDRGLDTTIMEGYED